MKELKISEEVYVLKSDVQKLEMAEKLDDMDYCIVRTYSAGVFAGYVKERNGKEITILNARRIWYWAGANSLSQLAVHGTKKPQDCKFAIEVPEILVTEVIEILKCTEMAKKSINDVKEWVYNE